MILVRFPFTGLSSTKQRPAVVLSSRAFSQLWGDVTVVAITSQDQSNPAAALAKWKEAGLVKPSWFKPLIATLSLTIITRRMGALQRVDTHKLTKVLDATLDSMFRVPST